MNKDEIKQSVKMAEVVSRYGLRPNRAGFICCPFHKEKTPSCKIYEDSFYCFGCGEHGDVFDFVMKYDGVPFSTAYVSLGGTYINKKGKSKDQIRREIRDIKIKAFNKKMGLEKDPDEPNQIDQVKKNILIYEGGMKLFPNNSEEYRMCRLNLAQEKSKYQFLLEEGGGENS